MIPSGILHQNTKCVIGNGVVIHIPTLISELQSLRDNQINYQDRLFISDRAHIVFDFHQQVIHIIYSIILVVLNMTNKLY